MKRLSNFKKVFLLCLAAMILMSLTVSAATSREMMENGAVSDGSVVYGNRRDGEVSDVSGNAHGTDNIVNDIGKDVSEAGDKVEDFAETILPGSTNHAETTDHAATTAHRAETTHKTTAHETTNGTHTNTNGTTKTGAMWGIVIAVVVVIAVVAIIFYLTKRH